MIPQMRPGPQIFADDIGDMAGLVLFVAAV